MPNVQGTPASGMFVGYPAGNNFADAFGALANAYTEKQKFDLQNQNAMRNAVIPQVVAQGYAPPGGFDFSQSPNNWMSRPWVQAPDGPAAQKAAESASTINLQKYQALKAQQDATGLPTQADVFKIAMQKNADMLSMPNAANNPNMPSFAQIMDPALNYLNQKYGTTSGQPTAMKRKEVLDLMRQKGMADSEYPRFVEHLRKNKNIIVEE